MHESGVVKVSPPSGAHQPARLAPGGRSENSGLGDHVSNEWLALIERSDLSASVAHEPFAEPNLAHRALRMPPRG